MITTFELINQWIVVINTIDSDHSIRLSCYTDKDDKSKIFHRCYHLSSSVLAYDILELEGHCNNESTIFIVIVLSNGDILHSNITINSTATTPTTNDINVTFQSIEEMIGFGQYYRSSNIIGNFHKCLNINEIDGTCCIKITVANVFIATNTKGIVLNTNTIMTADGSNINIKEVYSTRQTTSNPTAVLFLNGLSHLETMVSDLKPEIIARRRGLLLGWKAVIRSSEAHERATDVDIDKNAYDCFILGFDDGSLMYIIIDLSIELKAYSWQMPLSSSSSSSMYMPIDAILLANFSKHSYQETSTKSIVGLDFNVCNPLLATHLVIVSGSKVSLLGSRFLCNSLMPDFQSFDISILENAQLLSPALYKVIKAIFVDMSMFFLHNGALYAFTITSNNSSNNTNSTITRLTDPSSPPVLNINLNDKGILTILIKSSDDCSTNDMDIVQLKLGPEFDLTVYRHLFHYNSNNNSKSSIDLTSNIRNTLSKINDYVTEEVRKRTLITALDLEALRLINLLKLLEQKKNVDVKSSSHMLDNWNLFIDIKVSLRNELGSTTTRGKKLFLDVDVVALDEMTMKALHGRMIVITLAPVDRSLLIQEGIPSLSLPLNFVSVGNTYSSKFAMPVTSSLTLAPISIDISLNISLINVEIDYLHTSNTANSNRHANSIGMGCESVYQCACVFPLFYKEIPLDEMLIIMSSEVFMENKALGSKLVRDNRKALNLFTNNRVRGGLEDDENITMNIHVPKYNDTNINTEALANTFNTFERSTNTNNTNSDVAATIKPAFLKNIINNAITDKNKDLQFNVKLGQAVAISTNDDDNNITMDVYHIRSNDISLASQIHSTAVESIMKSLPNDSGSDEAVVYSDGDVYSLPRELQQAMSELASINIALSNHNSTNQSNKVSFSIIDNIINNIDDDDDDGGYNEIKTKTKQLLHIYSKLRTNL